MYRKRFRGKSSTVSGTSTVSNAGSSAVGTPGSNVSGTTNNDTTVSSPAHDTSNKQTPSPKKRGRPAKKQNFPSEETFLAPAPSPKLKSPPPARKPMREPNSSAENSPVLNVVRRKARRACDLDTPYYERILAISGLKFEMDGAKPHELDQEQIYFIRDLQQQMKSDDNKSKADEFLDKFVEIHNGDLRLLKKSMMPTRREVGDDGGYVSHGSLIHLLLEVPCFQDRLLELMFEKLLENVTEDNDRRKAEGLNCIEWTNLILHQMFDLSCVANPEKLTTKLLECFEFCQMPKAQKVFLQAFPSIIYGDNQQEVASCLSKVLKGGGENTPHLLDALCDMSASPEVKEMITENVIDMLKNGDRKFMPQIISFLLAHARYEEDKARIIHDIRQNAELTPFGIDEDKLKDDKTMLVKVVAAIGGGLNAMQDVAELWLNYIANTQNLKPIDIIVLVSMYVETKKSKLLNIIKSKCMSGAISEQLLETTFTHHGDALSEFFDNIMGIASFLIKSPDRVVSHNGAEWFKLLFLHLEAMYLRQKVLWGLINLLGVFSTQATDSVLMTLSDLVNNHLAEVLPQAALLMVPESLLDKVEIVSLEHARKIMDIVCQLAYSGHAQAEMLQSDINILIQKQLRSLVTPTKRKGIVGAVMATKHIAVPEEGDEKSNGNVSASSDGSSLILSMKGVAAQTLIDLSFKSTQRNPEVFGFFYDELASMLNSVTLCSNFEEWLSGKVADTFEELYIHSADIDPKTLCKEIKLKNYLSLDDDESNPIISGVGVMVANEAFKTNTNTKGVMATSVTLCAMFRLVRVLRWLTDSGKLGEIDAVLGCSVFMPVGLLNISRGTFISMTDPLEQVCVLNTLFVSVNWFREIVNAFCVTEDENPLKDKVVQRIRHIVYMESKILELMPAFPKEYSPPCCQFYSEIAPPKFGSAGKKPKKKRSNKKKVSAVTQSSMHPALDEVDNGLDEEEETDFEDDDPKQQSDVTDYSLKDLSAYFRELDHSVFMLLQEKLVFEPEPIKGEETSAELGPKELMFLLDDYHQKLEHALDKKPGLALEKKANPFGFANDNEKMTSTIKASAQLFYHLDIFDSKKIAMNAVGPVTYICDKLEQVVGFFQNLQEKNDGMRDGPGSETESAKQLQQCLYLLICCLKSTLSWVGFYDKENIPMTLEMLKNMGKRVVGEDELIRTPDIISHACKYIGNFGKFVMNLPSAVALIELLQVINSHDSDGKGDNIKKNKRIIYDLSLKFLQQEWPAVPKDFPSESVLVSNLVQSILSNSNQKMSKCLKFLSTIEENGEELRGGKNHAGRLENIPAITKSTLGSVFKVLSKTVVESARAASTEPESLTQRDVNNKYESTIQAWTMVVDALKKMTNIAKFHETKPLFACLVKDSQPIFRLFMDTAMPAMDKCFSKFAGEVHSLLKHIQHVTRFLQNLCCHGKKTNALGLVSQVPNLKFILEKLVQRVKGMLVVNKCANMVWVGNLKNKDIHGENIPSQMVESDTDEEEAERVAARRAHKSQKTQKSQAASKTQKSQAAGKTQKSQAAGKTQKSQKSPKFQKKTQAEKSQPAAKTQKTVKEKPKLGPIALGKKTRKMHKHKEQSDEEEEEEDRHARTQSSEDESVDARVNAKKRKKEAPPVVIAESDVEEEEEEEPSSSIRKRPREDSEEESERSRNSSSSRKGKKQKKKSILSSDEDKSNNDSDY